MHFDPTLSLTPSRCVVQTPGFAENCHADMKKADVAKHPKAFGHAGLLFNEPPGFAELFLI